MKLLSHGPEPCASANSAISAYLHYAIYYSTNNVFVKAFLKKSWVILYEYWNPHFPQRCEIIMWKMWINSWKSYEKCVVGGSNITESLQK